MSISDEIEALCGEGRLVKVEPSYPRPRGAGALELRFLYLTPEIYEFLMSDHSLAPETSADFTDFIFGERLEASVIPSMSFIVGCLD